MVILLILILLAILVLCDFYMQFLSPSDFYLLTTITEDKRLLQR